MGMIINGNNYSQNINGITDYVIETQEPTAENGYSWYRLYKSGWVEQGGIDMEPVMSGTGTTITLMIEMNSTNYGISLSCSDDEVSPSVLSDREVFTRRTTTSINILSTFSSSNSCGYGKYGFTWMVFGMSAN